MSASPRTALDALWDELLLDACASDGPIRDNDVRQAIAHYRSRIEAEAAQQAALLDVETLAEALRGFMPATLTIGTTTSLAPVEWRTVRGIAEEVAAAYAHLAPAQPVEGCAYHVVRVEGCRQCAQARPADADAKALEAE